MSNLVFVQGNTKPDLVAVLRDRDDPTQILDLTTALQVKFQMRKADDRKFTVNTVAVVDDPDAGLVHYSWGPTDLYIPGIYNVQWEVTYADSSTQTTVDDNTITVRRQ